MQMSKDRKIIEQIKCRKPKYFGCVDHHANNYLHTHNRKHGSCYCLATKRQWHFGCVPGHVYHGVGHGWLHVSKLHLLVVASVSPLTSTWEESIGFCPCWERESADGCSWTTLLEINWRTCPGNRLESLRCWFGCNTTSVKVVEFKVRIDDDV